MMDEILKEIIKKDEVQVHYILEQKNAERDFIEVVVVYSLKDYMAIIDSEKRDFLSIENEDFYKARLRPLGLFDDNRITREKVVAFIKNQDLTDRKFLKLRMTGHLVINEAEVDYKPNRANPWMGWSLIAIITLQVFAGLFVVYATHPDLSDKFFPHLMVMSTWLFFCGLLHYIFIAPSEFMKSKGVY
jgi:hypothetical protein